MVNLESSQALTPEILESIRQFDTCTIANAIERFGIRLRNEGYTLPGLHCVTGGYPRVIGFAATCRVRSANPPLAGGRYIESEEWWQAIEKLPVPRIAVVEHVDAASGGAAVGEVHAAILKAFQCAAVITNGGVRDVPAVKALEFPMFAHSLAVSHAYAHMVDFGEAVEIFGLRVRAGDLILADVHGAIAIPMAVAPKVAEVAAKIRADERRIIDVCASPGFSAAKLQEVIGSDR